MPNKPKGPRDGKSPREVRNNVRMFAEHDRLLRRLAKKYGTISKAFAHAVVAHATEVFGARGCCDRCFGPADKPIRVGLPNTVEWAVCAFCAGDPEHLKAWMAIELARFLKGQQSQIMAKAYQRRRGGVFLKMSQNTRRRQIEATGYVPTPKKPPPKPGRWKREVEK